MALHILTVGIVALGRLLVHQVSLLLLRTLVLAALRRFLVNRHFLLLSWYPLLPSFLRFFRAHNFRINLQWLLQNWWYIISDRSEPLSLDVLTFLVVFPQSSTVIIHQ